MCIVIVSFLNEFWMKMYWNLSGSGHYYSWSTKSLQSCTTSYRWRTECHRNTQFWSKICSHFIQFCSLWQWTIMVHQSVEILNSCSKIWLGSFKIWIWSRSCSYSILLYYLPWPTLVNWQKNITNLACAVLPKAAKDRHDWDPPPKWSPI